MRMTAMRNTRWGVGLGVGLMVGPWVMIFTLKGAILDWFTYGSATLATLAGAWLLGRLVRYTLDITPSEVRIQGAVRKRVVPLAEVTSAELEDSRIGVLYLVLRTDKKVRLRHSLLMLTHYVKGFVPAPELRHIAAVLGDRLSERERSLLEAQAVHLDRGLGPEDSPLAGGVSHTVSNIAKGGAGGAVGGHL